MQSTQLTEPELAFITDLTISYKNRRVAALKKATRKSHSAELETATLNSLINKLEALHSLALAASEQTNVNDSIPFAHHHYQEVVTHADVELPVIESLG